MVNLEVKLQPCNSPQEVISSRHPKWLARPVQFRGHMNVVSSSIAASSEKDKDSQFSDHSGTARQREMVAELCRFMGQQLIGKNQQRRPSIDRIAQIAEDQYLPPRVRQTLDRILAGDSEKQIARRLGISRHTVHVYVKTLYRLYAVSSRGELVARLIGTFDSAG